MARREPPKRAPSLSWSAANASLQEPAAVENAFRTRDEWLRLAAEGSQMGLWYWNEVTNELFWDAKTREMFGVPVDGEVTLESFYRALHPDDAERVTKTWRNTFEHGLPYEAEYRSHRPDGTTRWIYARGDGYYDDAAKPICMVGVVFDITERKEIEQERSELSGRLIKAQEDERSYLARELHDDFSQRLALLALGLENATESISESPERANQQLYALLNSAGEIGADLHTLSHRLHSSTLESLGFVPGISALCKEFATQQDIELDYSLKNVPTSVPPDAALCLFRIVQEGLRNMKRHSGASKAFVILEWDDDKLNVCVRDEGKGFDVKESKKTEGLGIRSMRERARLLGGRFEIHSELGKGTKIEAWVPLRPPSGVVND